MQEINDLKNIVIQSLESNGVLSQLRAQIRSSVFKIIEDQESRDGKSPAFFWENPLCQKIHKTNEGPVALELMHEFMEFYRMDYTCNVFVHESNYKATTERQALVSKLNLGQDDPSKPLLALIIERLCTGAFGQASNKQVSQTQGGASSSGKILHDKEAIESSLNDLKKPQEKSKEFIQQAKETPSLSLASNSQPKEKETSAKDIFASDKQLNKHVNETRQDSSKMLGAKKETDVTPGGSTGQLKHTGTSQGSSKITSSDAAMKKKVEVIQPEDDLDGRLNRNSEFGDPELDYLPNHEGDQEGEEESHDMNGQITSDEMYMSESHGYNFSITSEAIDQFDHVEDVEPAED